MKRLSDAEVKLFRALGEDYLLDCVESGKLSAPRVYDAVVREVFISNKQGPAVEALRRATKAIHHDFTYRLTPEFDELCKFEPEA